MPTFSIIIPALNEEHYLPNLLDSLAVQSSRDFEVVVVDGKSKDKTVAIAKTYKDKIPNLQVIVSPKASLPLQRNLGAKNAQGKWYVFVDADSVLLPYAIQRMKSFVELEKPKEFTTWCRPDSEDVGDSMLILFWNLAIESFIRFKRPFSPGPFTAVEKSAFTLVGGYDTNHAFNEDVDFGLRLDKQHIKLQVIRETLYVVSLRRFRTQGTLKVAQQYAQAALPVLFFKKSLSKMPGYIMGGQMYDQKKKQMNMTVLKNFNKKFQKIVFEFFS
jgi:glycosyltransferase involved in cell wall biosynthesis